GHSRRTALVVLHAAQALIAEVTSSPVATVAANALGLNNFLSFFMHFLLFVMVVKDRCEEFDRLHPEWSFRIACNHEVCQSASRQARSFCGRLIVAVPVKLPQPFQPHWFRVPIKERH